MLFKKIMTDMSLDEKSNDAHIEFRVHARGRALFRFNSIYDQQMADLLDT